MPNLKKAIAMTLLSILIAGICNESVSAQSDWTFADWCRKKKCLTSKTRHTVEVLLRVAGTHRCRQAEQNLIELRELSLRGNQIEVVTPLISLPNLTWLDLSDNQITDVTSLANLTNLTRLFLNNNKIEDMTPLADLVGLTRLNIRENPLERCICPTSETFCEF